MTSFENIPVQYFAPIHLINTSPVWDHIYCKHCPNLYFAFHFCNGVFWEANDSNFDEPQLNQSFPFTVFPFMVSSFCMLRNWIMQSHKDGS
jgi:hypothetical protein